MSIDYVNGKVEIEYSEEDLEWIQFFKDNRKSLVLTKSVVRLEKIFRVGVMDVQRLLDLYYTGSWNISEFKYLLLDISVASEKQLLLVFKLLEQYTFKNIVLILHRGIGEYGYTTGTVKYLKENFAVKGDLGG